jgi:hypothetical protein
MTGRDRTIGAANRVIGWTGTIPLLGILPIKLARFGHHGDLRRAGVYGLRRDPDPTSSCGGGS